MKGYNSVSSWQCKHNLHINYICICYVDKKNYIMLNLLLSIKKFYFRCYSSKVSVNSILVFGLHLVQGYINMSVDESFKLFVVDLEDSPNWNHTILEAKVSIVLNLNIVLTVTLACKNYLPLRITKITDSGKFRHRINRSS